MVILPPLNCSTAESGELSYGIPFFALPQPGVPTSAASEFNHQRTFYICQLCGVQRIVLLLGPVSSSS